MTAKQLLHDFIDALPEEDAAVVAAVWIPRPGRELGADERAAIEKGLAEADANELIAIEEIERDFGSQ